MKTTATLASHLLIMTSGQGVAADTCARALDFEKRRLAADEVVNLCESYQGKVVSAIEKLL